MLTLKQIRNDLKDIRCYHSRKEAFEQGFRVVGTNDIVSKTKRYNTAMQSAPTRLYDIYVGLYARNLTQEALSIEMCYSLSISRYSINGCYCTCRELSAYFSSLKNSPSSPRSSMITVPAAGLLRTIYFAMRVSAWDCKYRFNGLAP